MKVCINERANTNPEGTRTLNLRIDSPTFTFVSTCGIGVYDGEN